MQLTEFKSWMRLAENKPLVLGYGSLMSSDSRRRFSNIEHHGLMVQVTGYKRAWITRSLEEQQTYVGALPDERGSLNAQLIAADMDPALAEREKDYQFERVPASQIVSHLASEQATALQDFLNDKRVYICRSLASYPAEADFPIHRSYVDTCMAGCLEAGGEAAARAFVEQTGHWNQHLVDDRHNPQYPRAARVAASHREVIDSILDDLL